MTSNGKLDRAGLPAPEEARLAQGSEYVAARTLEEEVLVGVWSQVLGVERIGIDDNYFALGGDLIPQYSGDHAGSGTRTTFLRGSIVSFSDYPHTRASTTARMRS